MANNNIPITQTERIFKRGALIECVNRGGEEAGEGGPPFIIFISGRGLTRRDVLNPDIMQSLRCKNKHNLKFKSTVFLLKNV